MQNILGIDVGATGIKGAVVDVKKGVLVTEKIKFKTPSPATPKTVLAVVKDLIKVFNWTGKPFGIGFPAIIRDNICMSASNIDDVWLNFPIKEFFEKETGTNVFIINDADCAGIAEMEFGVGKGEMDTVIMLTLGTGIGSGFFYDGILVPNTELGQMLYKKSVAEHYASNSARVRKEMSWKEWGKELNWFLNHIEFLFSPSLIIVGGGVSKKFHLYKDYIKLNTRLEIATMLNNAGIIGVAYMTFKKLHLGNVLTTA